MEKEIVFVLLDEFADWEAAFLAPALCSGVMHHSTDHNWVWFRSVLIA